MDIQTLTRCGRFISTPILNLEFGPHDRTNSFPHNLPITSRAVQPRNEKKSVGTVLPSSSLLSRVTSSRPLFVASVSDWRDIRIQKWSSGPLLMFDEASAGFSI